MSTTELIFWIALAFVCVGLSALMSGMETGVYGLNMVRLHIRAGRRDGSRESRRARSLLAEVEPLERVLAAILIGNNAANYAGAIAISAALSATNLSEWGVVIVNAAVLTPLLFIFGETLPKDTFRASADRLLPPLAGVLRALRLGLTATLALPVVRLFGLGVSRVFAGADAEAVATARGRLLALLLEGRRSGALSTAQTNLVERAGLLRRRRVEKIMTPWTEVATLGEHRPRAQIHEALRTHRRRTYPVVDRRGRVLGLVDGARVWLEPDAPIAALMTPAVFIPPDRRLIDALADLRRVGARRAIVGTAENPLGVVVERDLLKPLLNSA